MDPRTQSQKQELVSQLKGYRSAVKLPDARSLLGQSKHLLNVASKLPTNMQSRPARTLMITGGISFLLVLLLKPKRRRRKAKAKALEAGIAPRSTSSHLLTFTLGLAQPLVRVWLTERTRRWLRK